MKVARIKRDIYDSNGVLVLPRNKPVILSEKLIEHLKNIGILKQVLQQLEEDNPAEVYSAVISELAKSSTIKSVDELIKHYPGIETWVVKKSTEIVNSLVSANSRYGWSRYVSLLFSYVDFLYAHSINTALMSCIVCTMLGYSDNELFEIAAGALFHDIGLTVLPKDILVKPSKLTEIEYAMIKNHCEMGHSMMKEVRIPELSKKIILQHHERIDGSGYPYRLLKDDIHEASLVTMIAEYCDTATTARSYKVAQPMSEVIAIMRKEENIFPKYIVDIVEKYLM